MSKKAEALRNTVYRVSNFCDPGKGNYIITKKYHGEEVEVYNLTVRPAGDGGSKKLDLWCDCMGFRRQTYPKIQHKHVKIVFDYQKRGEPSWADYRLGPENQVIFVGDSEE